MLKLNYLTNDVYEEIPFIWPNGYTIKNGTDGKPLFTGGNNFGGSDCGGYMVLNNGNSDKLYILQGKLYSEITTFPDGIVNPNITHLCGGGDYINSDTTNINIGGYIVFNNNSNFAYTLETTNFLNLTGLPNAGNVTILSGGGGNNYEEGFSNSGAIVVDNKLYRINHTVCEQINISGTDITQIFEINFGGFSNLNFGGFLLAKKSNDKKYIFYYDITNGNLVDTGNEADRIATMYVPNFKLNSNKTTKLYYLVGNDLHYYQYANSSNIINDIVISLPENAKLLFLSGGGGYSSYSISEYPAGYVGYKVNDTYFVYFLEGKNKTSVPINNLNLLALTGSNINRKNPFTIYDGHGYMITNEQIPCVHQDTCISIFKDGQIIGINI